MTVVRRSAATLAAAFMTVALLGGAPAQAAGDTSWGGYSVGKTAGTGSSTNYTLQRADTSWGGY